MNQLRMAVLNNHVLNDKRGKSGRDWTRTNDLTDVNLVDEDRNRNVILLEVESFNKGRF